MVQIVFNRSSFTTSLKKIKWANYFNFAPETVGSLTPTRVIIVRNHLVPRTGGRKQSLRIGLLVAGKTNKNVLLYRKPNPAPQLAYPIFTPFRRRVKALGQISAPIIQITSGSSAIDLKHYLGLSLMRFGGMFSTSVATVATVPDAPTIGPASGGSTQAFVQFVAPGNDGGSPITGYTATSTPGGLTATGTSSPLNVTGLTNGTSYTFTVHATNVIGNSAESSKSTPVTPNPVTAGVPQNVFMTLQGQSSAGATISPPAPTSPNQMTIVWDPVTNASQYKVYRAVNGGTYTLLATNVIVTNYTDLSATACVGVTAGSSGPPPVVNYPATTYQYKITAVVGGVESSQSASQSFLLYRNGSTLPSISGSGGWGGDFSFPNPGVNCFVNYNDTAVDPNGSVSFSFNQAFAGFQPYVGNNATTWNLWVGAFNFLNFDLRPTTSGQTWGLNPLRVGDVPIYNGAGGQVQYNVSSFGPAPVVGTWGTYKIALSTLLNDLGSNGLGPGVVQNAVYKFAIQDTTGSASGLWYVRNVYYSPT